MLYRRIGKMIQKAREEAGLSQEELASRLGYTQAALSNYELGKRRLYLANIKRIAKELKKPLSYFLDDSAKAIETNQGNAHDKVIAEINQILLKLPPDERIQILEYVRWRRERAK